jgi:hypothetical protein
VSVIFGRLTRALLVVGVIAGAIALPAVVGTPFMPVYDGSSARVALAAPALQDDDDDDGNDDPTNDNSDERNIEGQVIWLHEGPTPPADAAIEHCGGVVSGGDGSARVGMVGGDVCARIYNNQIHNSGIRVDDYVEMQGEYVEHGIFDAYQINVRDRGSDDNDNDD